MNTFDSTDQYIATDDLKIAVNAAIALVLCPTANERSAQLEVYPAVNDT